MTKVTMAEVAKQAKVSKSTVSQFINKRYDYMSEDTKKRIEEAIRELNYQPNAVARSLKQKKTSTIGVIVANILHAFSTQIIRTIEDESHEQDYHVIVCNADDDPVKEQRYIEMLRAKQVDGLIIFPAGDNLELYQSLVKAEFPVVFMDRLVPDVEADFILLDNEQASELAVRHFADKGYRRIGMVTTSLIHHVTPRIERMQGFKKALANHGLPVRDEYIKGTDTVNIKETLKEMFSLPEPPDALLAGNDLALMEILYFVKEQGLSVPDDMALISIDEVSYAQLYQPALTTVKQPAIEMGRAAASLLFRKIEQEGSSDSKGVIRFTPELISRDSC